MLYSPSGGGKVSFDDLVTEYTIAGCAQENFEQLTLRADRLRFAILPFPVRIFCLRWSEFTGVRAAGQFHKNGAPRGKAERPDVMGEHGRSSLSGVHQSRSGAWNYCLRRRSRKCGVDWQAGISTATAQELQKSVATTWYLVADLESSSHQIRRLVLRLAYLCLIL